MSCQKGVIGILRTFWCAFGTSFFKLLDAQNITHVAYFYIVLCIV